MIACGRPAAARLARRCAPAQPRQQQGIFGLSDHLLGIDIGGTKVACALADAQGRLLARCRHPVISGRAPREEVAEITAALRGLLAEAGAQPSAVGRIGVSAPGPLDSERGLILGPPNLPGWNEVPICAWLEAELGCPASLENDANAAALAEWRAERDRGGQAEHLVYLTMSTGIGAGLVLGGRIHRGRRDLAGEVGHAPVVWNGEPCVCGLRGCLEAYIGGAAWTRRLQRETPDASRVLELAGDRNRARPEHVVEAAGQGDAFALAELERFNDLLARAIVQIAFTLAPDVVVLGTIASAAGEALCLQPVRDKLSAALWPQLAEQLVIRGISLGDDLPYHAGLCVAQSAMVSS